MHSLGASVHELQLGTSGLCITEREDDSSFGVLGNYSVPELLSWYVLFLLGHRPLPTELIKDGEGERPT
ncbi:MAG: hypothetical protein AAFO06_19080, partial [Cyanobacteria bacterium J06597_16]